MKYILFFLALITIIGGFFIYKLNLLYKKSYTIVFFGDSLVDTMRTEFPFLVEGLQKKYPNVKFKLYNYGVTSQNIEMGSQRYDKKLEYKNRKFPPLSQLKADIIIVGSWAYNPFSPHDPEKHKKELTQLVERIRKDHPSAKLYLLKEIAPQDKQFGKGVFGANWSEDQASTYAKEILQQLANTNSVAKELNVPLIDVYSQSTNVNSPFGKTKYTSSSDGIHPSPSGHTLTANIIISTISLPLPQPVSYDLFNIQSDLTEGNPYIILPDTKIEKTIFYSMVHTDELTTSTSLSRYVGLDKMLNGKNLYTFFIRNNNSFDKIPREILHDYLLPGNKEKLTTDLQSTIVNGLYPEMKENLVMKALNGGNLVVNKKNGQWMINDSLIVLSPAIKTTNGIIYIVDTK